MNEKVIVLPEAREDLVDIYLYIAENDSVNSADLLLEKLECKCISLSGLPERGHAVPELRRIHVEGYREIHFKPYRIIYQYLSGYVYVHAILDGRRELQELLENRFLR